jgi:hypothetical protein
VKLFGLIKDPDRICFSMHKDKVPGEELYHASPVHKFEVHLKWEDAWIGFFWDQMKRVLWICPLPMLAVRVRLGGKR